jgi:uncharacterized protein YlbG (UPF0298 family)
MMFPCQCAEYQESGPIVWEIQGGMTPWSQDASPRRGGSECERASEHWKGEVSSPSKVDLTSPVGGAICFEILGCWIAFQWSEDEFKPDKDRILMENENKKSVQVEPGRKTQELLSSAAKGEDITVRDDLYDFPGLLDAVRICRRGGFRFRLIDSGKLDRSQLEWLAEAGADVYSSDEARTDLLDLELVNRSCRRGGAVLAYFHHGPFEPEGDTHPLAFFSLLEMGRNGIYLHLTNREKERDINRLGELAFACRRGKSWLVYYHHGAVEGSLEELARNGVWFHATEKVFKEKEERALVLDRLKEAISAGLRLVLHVEKGLDYSLLRDIIKSGSFVLFRSSLFDYRSPFKELERKAKQMKLDFKSYYLYPDFLP